MITKEELIRQAKESIETAINAALARDDKLFEISYMNVQHCIHIARNHKAKVQE